MILNTDTTQANQSKDLKSAIDGLESGRYFITQLIFNGKTHYFLYDLKQQSPVNPTSNNRWSLQHADGKFWLYSIKPIIRIIYNDEYCIDDIPDKNDGVHGREIWFYLDEKYTGSLEGAHQSFLVSNYGRYKSYTGYNAIIVTPWENFAGYLMITLTRNNESIKLRAHRPVAYYYLLPDMPAGTRFDNSDIHHRASKTDNEAWNLQIITDRKIHRQLDRAKRAAEAAQIAA